MDRSFIALATNLTLCCTFLAAFLLKVNEELRQADPTNSFVQINPFVPTLVILIANFGVLAVVLGIVLQQLYDELKNKNVRELLVFACSPTVKPLYEVEKEAEEVKGIMDKLAKKLQTKPCKVCNGTAADLNAELTAVPTRRFLFSGHADFPSRGGHKTLAFTNPNGSINKVKSRILKNLFRVSSVGGSQGGALDQLELVFLNGCESEKLGRAVCKAGVPFVVCWETKVVDKAAREFATNFFQAVGKGHLPERAYKHAVMAFQTQKDPDSGKRYYIFEAPDTGMALDTTEPQRGGSMASDECKRSEGVTWNRTAKKYQIQLSIGDAPQLKLGRYDDLEEANARVAPFNELKNKLRSQRMPNRQIYDVLKKLRDGDAGVRSAVVAMPTVLLA